ncbi:class I SAM-dependent methyltransferase [Nocardioides sp. T2.26MG-1]|uniref:class I SAM-dependent methyltransferase n=1 Tax=Nocardioides sp. T2.26MG-1 TaxID=3041166 RepID=UPI002477AF90|nr:class I SAM-dependent methyltransferase [Nocardioides sp. T2.26MG-1]CAI9419105.1 Ubiquinone biosynthesis O-methyltransferase, mitochondrial [Nocardioides sp. T2.26MG-1]
MSGAQPLDGPLGRSLDTVLSIATWAHPADEHDRQLAALCVGPTLDVGCGPGRLTAHLADRGHVVLGIDVAPECVGQARERGAAALHRDVFDRLPGEGRWRTALLADGNVGIGGDPVALLHRLRELLDPRGRVVVELAPPGAGVRRGWATLRYGGGVVRPLRWAVVGADDVDRVADEAGLAVTSRHVFGGRWCAVLEEAA